MKYSVLGNLGIGLVCLMVVGCSNSEVDTSSESQLAGTDTSLNDKDVVENISAPSGESLTTYLVGVDDKLGQLKDKHAKLMGQVKEAAPGSDSVQALEAKLAELTTKGEELQFQIEAMKAAKGDDQLALQAGMDKALADLDQSYDTALAPFLG